MTVINLPNGQKSPPSTLQNESDYLSSIRIEGLINDSRFMTPYLSCSEELQTMSFIFSIYLCEIIEQIEDEVRDLLHKNTRPLAGLCRQKILATWLHFLLRKETNKILDRGLMHGTNFPEHWGVYYIAYSIERFVTDVEAQIVSRNKKTVVEAFSLLKVT
ncbi:hypothetical protein WN51_06571 [Melipona quadrifasciata]|uniref:Uncharacterized protein n=1 Tax=Melipona quadrifasciata TaxID=166423 RepID=A0A0M8ZRI5_9HYME|nr:hypothetical protein WN51_06571 [Melipona quadrifasciata]